MIVQDEKKTLHPLATIFIKQCYETLIDVAQESGGHLPYRTNFILDEFANMPPLKDVTTMVTAARSRHIRFTFIIQNFAQLTKVYGKEDAETIKGNCNILYLISSELQALEELSKMCGEVKSKEKEKTSSTPLVTVSDLQRMPMGQVIWLRLRMMPFKTKLTPNWKMTEMNSWHESYGKAKYITREKKEVQLFDIREFMKQKKKEQMEKMMSSSSDGAGGFNNPFAGGNPFGSNPFGSNPFGSNPFGSNPFASGSSPFGSSPSLPSADSDKDDDGDNKMPSLKLDDYDDLVKKIEAKIAALEDEEKKEEEEEAKKEKKTSIVEAEINEEKEVKDSSMYENGTNSDDFFDDFFSDS